MMDIILEYRNSLHSCRIFNFVKCKIFLNIVQGQCNANTTLKSLQNLGGNLVNIRIVHLEEQLLRRNMTNKQWLKVLRRVSEVKIFQYKALTKQWTQSHLAGWLTVGNCWSQDSKFKPPAGCRDFLKIKSFKKERD